AVSGKDFIWVFFAERCSHRLRGLVEIDERAVRGEGEHGIGIVTGKSREMFNFLFGTFSFCDVTRHHNHPPRLAFSFRRQARRRFEQNPLAIAMTMAQLSRALLAMPPRLFGRPSRERQIVWMNEIKAIAPDQLARVITENQFV